MEKRYSWGFQIGSWALLSVAVLLFLFNIFMYTYLSPAANAIAGKAANEGNLNIQILPAEEAPSVPVSPGGGGGAGSGGGGGGVSGLDVQKVRKPFAVSPESLSVSLVVGEKVIRQLAIRNYLMKELSLSSEVLLLKSILEVPQYVSLGAIEEKTIDVKIGPAEKGLLTGKIKFTSGAYWEEIPVVIDVKSRNFLFDVSAEIPSSYKRIVAGTEIPMEISLKQVANPVKVDVSINYIVKDFSGVVYLEESETMSVENSKEYTKKISTKDLPLGKYIAGIEVQYPGAFATSSSQFEIITPEEAELSKISRYLSIVAICLVAISVLVLIGILLRQKSLEKMLTKKQRRKV